MAISIPSLDIGSLKAAATAAATNAQYLYQQTPDYLARLDAQNELNKMVTAFSQPRVDTFVPSQRYQDIVGNYAQQHYNIVGSSGTQQYLGTTPDKRYSVYSEAGGERPFQANILTSYQKGALGDIFGSGDITSRALGAVRGVETITPNLLVGAYEGFLGERGITRQQPQVAMQQQPAMQPQQQVGKSPLSFITDPLAGFFGGYAKSGYAAGAGAIQPFAGARAYTPVYETLMAPQREERLIGGKTIASVATTRPNEYMVDSGAGIKAPFTSVGLRAQQSDQSFADLARSAVSGRAGYTPQSELGDIRTQNILKGYELAQRGFGLMGVNVASEDQMTGKLLEAQRQGATTLKGERFFGGELQKWAQNKAELASEYHAIGKESGKAIAANPFEYQGDLAVEFLKGAPTRSTERFSPVSGELGGLLPVRGGLQGYAWQSALATDRGATQPAKVSFMPAVEYVGKAEGLQGPYGALFGGKGVQYVPQSSDIVGSLSGSKVVAGKSILPVGTTDMGEGIRKPFTSASFASIPEVTRPSDIALETTRLLGGGFASEAIIRTSDFFLGGASKVRTIPTGELPIVETTTKESSLRYEGIPGGVAAIITTTGTTKREGGIVYSQIATPIPSGLDSLNKSVRDFLKLPSVETGEAGIRIASLAFPSMGALTMPGAFETALTGKKTSTELFNPFAGQYKAFYEQPLLVPISYGAGAIFGGGTKLIGAGFTAAKGAAVPLLESTSRGGQIARFTSIVGTPIIENAPKFLGAVYAADIGSRVTGGFTTFSPETVAPKLRGILMQEAVPMGVGFGLADTIASTARGLKTGFAEYKMMVAERTPTTPRLSLTKTEGEVALGQFKTKVPTFGEYAKYEIQRSIPLKAYDISAYTTSKKGLYRDITNLPTKVGYYADTARTTTLDIAPEYLYRGIEGVKGKTVSGVTRVGEIMGVGKTPRPEFTRGFVDEETAVTLARYTRTPERAVVPEFKRPFVSEDVALSLNKWYGESRVGGPSRLSLILSQKPDIAVKAFWQERGYSLVYEGAPRYAYSLKGRTPSIPSIGDVGDFAGSISKFKPTVGGGVKASIGEYKRITEKTVGGAKSYGLAKEASLKSIGRQEPLGRETRGLTIGRTEDFRGRPVSGTMKPMGKQAAGVSLLTEELPRVEGMTRGRVISTAPQSIWAFPSISVRQQGIVQVTEPSLEFRQERRVATEVRPSTAIYSELSFGKGASIAQITGVSQRAMQSTFLSQATRAVTETRTRQDQRLDRLTDVARITGETQTQRERQRQDQRVWSDIYRITGQRTATITDERITTRTKKSSWYDETIITGGGGEFYPPGGGDVLGGKRRSKFAFRETIPVRGLLFKEGSQAAPKRKPTKKRKR